MILFIGKGGRAGNQLFQLAFLESIRRPRERVLCTGLGESLGLLRGMRGYFNFDGWTAINLADHVARPLLLRMCRVPSLIGSFLEGDGNVSRRGSRRQLRFVDGYFQSEDWIRTLPAAFSLQDGLLALARQIVPPPGTNTPLFVHVRRGDYLTYARQERDDPSLPGSYYVEAVSRLKSCVRSPHFYFVGDDPDWCESQFDWLEEKTVSRNAKGIDLAIMSLCAGGVVSNSSFAWWGAHLCSRSAPVIAPRYWFRWRRKEWYPRRIRSAMFDYIDPNEFSGKGGQASLGDGGYGT